MNQRKMKRLSIAAYTFALVSLCVTATKSYGETPSVCESGRAEPPFLSYGVDPNALLLIDNSASMYDMAYVEETGYCKDESFATATSYQGYFNESTWYRYNFANSRFEPQNDNSACSGVAHSNPNVCLTLNTTTPSSTIFLATGKFLNWAATSKFDIQKKILTGGKFETDGSAYNMVLESRGCSASRFVKEVQFTDGTHLTLGIRAAKTSEKVNANDNTTRIDIFGVSSTGFQDEQCKAAITALQDPTGQGAVSQPLQGCMGYTKDSPNYIADSNAAFNAAVHNCWFLAKQGTFPNGTMNDRNACENLYKGGALPASITPDDTAYVCSGSYDFNTPHADREGYLGRCWEPEVLPAGCLTVPGDDPDRDSVDNVDPDGTNDDIPFQAESKPYRDPFRGKSDNYIYDCTGNFNDNTGNCAGGTWKVRTFETVAGACQNATPKAADWTDDGNLEACAEQALKDYCGHLTLPEVIDPTDLATGNASEFWNLPAVLVDSGVVSQLNEPVVTLRGYVLQTTEPSGLVQDYADDIRFGAMKFNGNGSATECSSNDNMNCYVGNQDGSQLVQEIGQGAVHKATLVNNINETKADSWTPLAEAMLNTIGYYSQITTDRQCNADDFTVGTDPIQYYCQDNHVVIITDGSSSADLNASVKTMADGVMDDGLTTTEIGECRGTDIFNDPVTTLSGSTYFDNLTYFGKNSTPQDLYGTSDYQISGKDKKTITTHIIVSGTLRDTGTADECNPEVLMTEAAVNGGTELVEATTPEQLRVKLEQTFAGIRAGASAGSAASVISSSSTGEGSVVQAIFWPKKTSSTDATVTVSWAGEVHALFINATGHLYEDTDGDRKLNVTVDKRVTIYFDNTDLVSKGCYALNSDGTCDTANQVDLDAVRYLWSANDWLAKISNTNFPSPGYDIKDQLLNRSGSDYISDKRRRYIFTWNDLNNDGIVVDAEVLPFVSEDTSANPTNWSTFTVAGTRRAVTNDFNPGVAADNAEVNKIVQWIRGVEVPGYRSRTVAKKMRTGAAVTDITNTDIVWRLGDIVHSTPTVVARPAEGLHLLYSDTSYGKFVARWAKRRHMAYFGANDGMMHAVNAGFYNESEKKFCLTADCANETGKPELGAEMWAYVPYNLLPHLKCLTSPGYVHKYYVDQRPRIFDAKIFPPDSEHPDGWGTVLVGSMRFGGSRIEADRLGGDTSSNTDNRYFTSSYFLLDITNPEAPPPLLGELTMLEDPNTTSPADHDWVDMGFTTAIPAPAVMKSATANEWYLLMGSGPTVEEAYTGIDPESLPLFNDKSAIKGYSGQKPKVAVFPLKGLTTNKIPFRIPNTEPTSTNDAGVFTFNGSGNGFVSDMITVDYDLNPYYNSDAVYFGTVEHGTELPPPTTIGKTYDDVWDGKLYRIVMRDKDNNGDQIVTTPYNWLGLTPKDGNGFFSPLFDAHQPITAAASVGSDGHNYWLYFGTGRFYDAIDKPDNAQQSFYGIKELTDCNGEFLWTSNIDKTSTSSSLGHRGLVNVSNVLVQSETGLLYCTPGDLLNDEVLADSTCLPQNDAGNTITTFDSLITNIAGSGTSPDSSCVDNLPAPDGDGIVETQTGKDGWYRNFPVNTRPRERNLGQATLLGGLVTFTTYQPYEDPCQQEGQSYLYGLYYQTGTPWRKTVFGSRGLDGDQVLESIPLGLGMTTTPNLHVGSEEGPTAVIQTSTGEIIGIQQTNLPLKTFKSGRESWRER